jgi:glycerol kinase
MKKDTAQFILVIDQGTTSSRAIIFDRHVKAIAVAQKEFKQFYPDLGWVEHDPEEIWESVLEVCREVLVSSKINVEQIAAMGISNQRETTIVWDRTTGKPIYPAIVWQDRRTADVCAELKSKNHESLIREKTGLLLDPYFSATKVAWILDHVSGAREKANRGELAFGTIDSFLISRLTKGKRHVTDITNASRTALFNIPDESWDDELLSLFDIPRSLLPEVLDNCADFGEVDKSLLGGSIPIAGVAGDQQAAAIGQACFSPGMTKSTYGTGCFVLLNTGDAFVRSKQQLLSTIIYRIDGVTQYALEGSIFNSGTVVQWMRDEMKFFEHAYQTEEIAASLKSNHGVYFVPAFTGLGAPYWRPDVRGGIVGLTRNANSKTIVRAGLEAICYQTKDLMDAINAGDAGKPNIIRADGGMAANNWLMQYLADILGVSIEIPDSVETTAKGAAFLAALQVGLIDSLESVQKLWRQAKVFKPRMSPYERDLLYTGWQHAIRQVSAK